MNEMIEEPVTQAMVFLVIVVPISAAVTVAIAASEKCEEYRYVVFAGEDEEEYAEG